MKLDAPLLYDWHDEDVRFEKEQSFINGMILGIVTGCAISILLMLLGLVIL